MYKVSLFLLMAVFLSACKSTPVKPNTAQPKTVEVEGKTLVFSGEYWVKKNSLIIFVNGDPVMRGSFPPYTPTRNLKADYEGLKLGVYCYFSSVLSNERGLFGVVAGAVQNARSKSGDKCEVKIADEIVEHLYF